MKEFLVVYTNSEDHFGEVEEVFGTKTEAEKFIKEQNEKEDCSCYNEDAEWTYKICEVVAEFVTTVSIKRDIEVKRVKS